jgi:hypothetical protein
MAKQSTVTVTTETETPKVDVQPTTDTTAANAPAVQQPAPSTPAYDKAKLDAYKTKSEKIRYLDSCGFKRGQIAKELNIIYQHVRNVLVTPLKAKQS